jgi:hypothetical protein
MNCPLCGRTGKPVAGGLYKCAAGHFFDDRPDEGGTVNDPAKAAEIKEQHQLRKRKGYHDRTNRYH